MSDTVIEIVRYRAFFYLAFRSTAVQRWAARQAKNEFYYALTPLFWRKLMGTKTPLPNGVAGRTTSSGTMYFECERSALDVKTIVIAALVREGILKQTARLEN